MTEFRVRCSGQGRIHTLHVYLRGDDAEWHRNYLEKQPWTKPCRPFLVESRLVGPWQKVEVNDERP